MWLDSIIISLHTKLEAFVSILEALIINNVQKQKLIVAPNPLKGMCIVHSAHVHLLCVTEQVPSLFFGEIIQFQLPCMKKNKKNPQNRSKNGHFFHFLI